MREQARPCVRFILVFAAALSFAACATEEMPEDLLEEGELDDAASDSDALVGASCSRRSGANCALIPGGYCHPTGICTVPCEGYCNGNNTFCVEDPLRPVGICVQKTSITDDQCDEHPADDFEMSHARTAYDGGVHHEIEIYELPYKQRRSRYVGDSDAADAEELVCAPGGGIVSFNIRDGGYGGGE